MGTWGGVSKIVRKMFRLAASSPAALPLGRTAMKSIYEYGVERHMVQQGFFACWSLIPKWHTNVTNELRKRVILRYGEEYFQCSLSASMRAQYLSVQYSVLRSEDVGKIPKRPLRRCGCSSLTWNRRRGAATDWAVLATNTQKQCIDR